MKEQDYIDAKALGTITAALSTLKDLTPANLKDIMTEDEHKIVMSTIDKWQLNLFNKFSSDGD